MEYLEPKAAVVDEEFDVGRYLGRGAYDGQLGFREHRNVLLLLPGLCGRCVRLPLTSSTSSVIPAMKAWAIGHRTMSDPGHCKCERGTHPWLVVAHLRIWGQARW